jgi:hypothetical protein
MYEITIRIDNENEMAEARILREEVCSRVNIHDEPFVCSHCGAIIKGTASKKFFDAIDNELCNKCLDLQNRMKKLQSKITELEFKFFCRNVGGTASLRTPKTDRKRNCGNCK